MSEPRPTSPRCGAAEFWDVHRQDDNGNRFVVQTGLGRQEAERLAARMEATGHKQIYWIESRGPAEIPMIDTYKELISNQFEAAFCMLAACVDRCPDGQWNAAVGNLKYCQVVFHTLFFADVYLGQDLKSLREQSFHREHASVFADYEELEERRQQALYEKLFIRDYLQHCRDKAVRVVAAETDETLSRRPGFDWLKFSRAEVHVYNIRHIQHHAAQLSLRLRHETGDGIPWVGSGWREIS